MASSSSGGGGKGGDGGKGGAWSGFGARMLGKMGFKGRLGAQEQGVAEPVSLDAVAQSRGRKLKRRGLGAAVAGDGRKKKQRSKPDAPRLRAHADVPRPERIRASELRAGPPPPEEEEKEEGRVRRRRGLLVHHTVLLEGAAARARRVWADVWARYFEFDARCTTPEQVQAAAAVRAFVLSSDLSHLCDEARFTRYLSASAGLLPSLGFDVAVVADRSQGIMNDVLDRFDAAYCRAPPSEEREAVVVCRTAVVDALVQLRHRGWKVCVLHPGSRARAQHDLARVSRLDVMHDAVVSGSCLLQPARPYTDFVREAANRLALRQDECVVLCDGIFQTLDARASSCRAVATLVDAQSVRFFEPLARAPPPQVQTLLRVSWDDVTQLDEAGEEEEEEEKKGVRRGPQVIELLDVAAYADFVGEWRVFGVYSEDGVLYECETVRADGEVVFAGYGNKERLKPERDLVAFRRRRDHAQ